jgi:non-specific serine/threonine protein kinase
VSVSEIDVLDGADSLAAKSLVRTVVAAPGQTRLAMLETTREFCLEQAAETGELEALRRCHARYYLALAEQAEAELWGPAASYWLDRLAADHDNMRAALEWGLSEGGPIGGEIALRLAGALARYWWTRSYLVEGQHWLTRALASAHGRSAARMKALHGAGWLAHFRRDSGTARALFEQSLTIARELDDRWTVAWVLHGLGRIAYFDRDQEAARSFGEQSLAVAEALGDRWLIAWALHLLGLAAHIAGDFGAADAFYARSLAIRLDLGHHEAVGILYQLLGISAHRQRKFVEARCFCQGFLAISRELGSPWHLSNALAQFASLAAAQHQPERAARLIGAAALVNQTFRTRPIPLLEDLFVEGVGLARQALGEAVFTTALARGQAMTPEEAIAESLAVEVEPGG